jgi:hypothetical protein
VERDPKMMVGGWGKAVLLRYVWSLGNGGYPVGVENFSLLLIDLTRSKTKPGEPTHKE